MSNTNTRVSDHDIAGLFVDRWSTRAFDADAVIPDKVLLQSFEAARWAPSGSNIQPWRFVYARRGSAQWPLLLGALNERNQSWAGKASALVAVLSRNVRDAADGVVPSRSHSFDAGAAWSNFAHQAHLLGWTTRAMGGFDHDAARKALALPADFDVHVFIAIGKPGDKASLPKALQALETRTDRLPIEAIVAEGKFAFAAHNGKRT
jgi:nitroreductase